MMNTYDFEVFRVVPLAEIERDFEAAARLADERPVLICGANGYSLLLFSWDDYMSRFGALYTETEIAAIEAACRAYQD